MHLHFEYAETRGMLHDKRWKWAVLLFFTLRRFTWRRKQFPRIGAPDSTSCCPATLCRTAIRTFSRTA